MSEHGELLTNLEIENDQLRADLKNADEECQTLRDKIEELGKENEMAMAELEKSNEILRNKLDEIKVYLSSIGIDIDAIYILCKY